MSVPQGQDISNNTEPMLKSLAISYNNNQLADLELWNSLFAPISLLRIKKFLSSNAQNITYSLFLIEMFIKQCFFKNKPIKNFLKLVDIGFAAWHLINIIYDSGWNKLRADENNKTFHQCVSSCFIKNSTIVPKTPKSNPHSDLSKSNKSKLTQSTDNKKLYA